MHVLLSLLQRRHEITVPSNPLHRIAHVRHFSGILRLFLLAFSCQLEHVLENLSSINEWPRVITKEVSPNVFLRAIGPGNKKSAFSLDVGSLSPPGLLHAVVVVWHFLCNDHTLWLFLGPEISSVAELIIKKYYTF